jgi:hypothetical protein
MGIPKRAPRPNLAPREGFRIRPLSSVGAKGAESGGKRRQIRRPFHPDVQIPRTIRVKRVAKPDPVKAQAADHPPLLFTEPACL